ncbi:TPA: tape measure protein [Escherichia coli]|uniref:tape measure protein n=1 Tax=Escherichia coli TaxID=562 RepID=UPI000BE8B3CA|nr:tape measure protein [Escherichia coli]EFH4119694.1 tape measure protein [Escherichia coli]HAJ1570082.1 tape measure protein [Escherichia coli]HCP4716691.1 tape measure protein [Escherichia coli]
MADHKVDSFIVELGFNENVIKGLQRVEKAAMQSATRIEKNLNRAFRINTKEIDKNLSSSLNNVEKKLNRTFSRLEKRTRQSKAFQFTTSVNERVRRKRAAEELMSDRAVRAAYQANMSRLKGINPFMHKYVKSQFYGLSKEAGSVDPSKFNEKLAQLNANVRESLAKAKSKLKTPPALEGVNKASSSLDSLSSAAIKAGAAFVSFEALLDSYRKVMEVGLKRAASERATEFVFGSNAQQVKDYTVSLSKQTGMDVSELQSQFAGFGASSQNTLGLENSEKLFKEMVVYGRSMGRSDDEIHRALVAIEQMASKGQIMSEELKGQLGEAMPGIIQEFVKALGLKSEKQLLDLMKKGLTADSTLLKVMGQLDKTIKEKGGYEVVSNSTQTQLGNLKSEWNNYLNDIFKGSEQGLRDFAKSLTNFLESLGGSGKTLGEELGSLFDGMAEGIDTLTTISYRVQGFVDEMTLAYRSLDDTTKKIVDGLSDGLVTVLKDLAGVVAVRSGLNAVGGIAALTRAISNLGNAAYTAAGKVETSTGGGKARQGRVSVGDAITKVMVIGMATDVINAIVQPFYDKVMKSSSDPMDRTVRAATKPTDQALTGDMNSLVAVIWAMIQGKSKAPEPLSPDAISSLKNRVDTFSQDVKMIKPVVNIQPQTLNITTQTILDGKVIDERTTSHVNQMQEDTLLNSSYPED